MRVFLALLCCLAAGTTRAQYAPDPEIGTVQTAVDLLYYDVTGTDTRTLAASLHEHGPRESGKRFFGLTEWEINAEYRWVGRDTGCTMDDVAVRVAIRTRLPRWRRKGRVDVRTRRAWDTFVRDLDLHEKGHRDLAAEAGDAIRWQLVSLNEPTCRTMEAAAERAVAAVLNEYETRNRTYDRDTGHGRTQGAVWPPAPDAYTRR